LREAAGELPPKRRVGDDDDQRVLDGELFQPRRRLVDSSGLCFGRILPAESQKQSPHAHGECPPRERETKPTEIRAFEAELAQQRGGDDLAPRRQQPRRGDGPRRVAGEHQAGRCRQSLEIGRSPLARDDAGGFIGLSPRAETRGVDPPGVDVRGAGVANQGDATLGLS
jgi:hypothetical protein